MLAILIGFPGVLVMMASMMLVALGIAGTFVSAPRLGGTWFDRPIWHWFVLSIACLALGFTLYFSTACIVAWAIMQ